MSESYSLPTEPEGIVASLLERFNSGKVSAMMGLYAPEAVFIAKDGRTITDHTEIAAELDRDLSLGLPLEAKARHVFVADDIAQIVVDWSIDGTGPDGKHVHVEGTASDVARLLPVRVSNLSKRGEFTHSTTHRQIRFHVYVATTCAVSGTWRAPHHVDDLPMSNAQRRVLAFADQIAEARTGKLKCVTTSSLRTGTGRFRRGR